MTWQNSVSQLATVATVAVPANHVRHVSPVPRSAIDQYYDSTFDILTKADPAYFSAYPPTITSLLYVGLISATENYFRDILGFMLGVCPVSRQQASEKKIQLGSLLWGGPSLHSRTAFDFIAFSAAKNISETFKEFTDCSPSQHGLWRASLRQYDLLCEVRHGVVHSGSILSGKNALRLGVPETKYVMMVSPSYANLQEAGAVCASVVQSANNELFEVMVKRWAVDWRALPSWKKSSADRLFERVFAAFYSSTDAARGAISNAVDWKEVRKRAKISFGV